MSAIRETSWLVEVGAFPRTAPRVIEALEAARIRWVRYEDGMRDDALPGEGACVVFWGSLGAAYEQRVAGRWVPGALGDADRFRCSVYAAQLGPWLANADVVVTTVRELVSDRARVLQPLGDPEVVFVRPDSALKPFAGRQLPASALSLAALDHGFYYDDESLPVVVSTAKRVTREWRFVVADGAVVAGCAYDPTRQGHAGVVPSEATSLAARVATHGWQAAPVYVVDVGEVDGELRVMELNPFSGADLYECDARAVVDAVTRIALRLHAQR